MILASAGILSPDSSLMTSPGTSSRAGREHQVPVHRHVLADVGPVVAGAEAVRKEKRTAGISRPVGDYLKMFYADTALYGNTPGLMCCYEFFGAEHVVFGSDMPWDNQFGLRYTRETIQAIEQMPISDAEKKLIFEDNARNLLRLSI